MLETVVGLQKAKYPFAVKKRRTSTRDVPDLNGFHSITRLRTAGESHFDCGNGQNIETAELLKRSTIENDPVTTNRFQISEMP
jgi:hypothetical protein